MTFYKQTEIKHGTFKFLFRSSTIIGGLLFSIMYYLHKHINPSNALIEGLSLLGLALLTAGISWAYGIMTKVEK